MKKIAPPGRRASSRVKKFNAEEEGVEPIDAPSISTEEDAVVSDHTPALQNEEPQHEVTPTPVVIEAGPEPEVVTKLEDEPVQHFAPNHTASDASHISSAPQQQSEMQHESDPAASYDEMKSNEVSDADEEPIEDDVENEEAKAHALALQQEAERLAQQIRAEQEAAQARRSQRLKFLDAADDFVGTLEKEITSQTTSGMQPTDFVAMAVQDASKSYQAPAPAPIVEPEEEVYVPRVQTVPVVTEEPIVQPVPRVQTPEPVEIKESETDVTFNALASKLFFDEPPATTTIDLANGNFKVEEEETKQSSTEAQTKIVLSRPTRIGMLDKQPKAKAASSATTTTTTTSAEPSVHILSNEPPAATDDMTAAIASAEAAREGWMASQEDMHKKRTDFHGAVTYAFDGVFSWQMYGVAQATEPDGSPYTEYVMRCQWGTDFQSLRPWMIARRFREFDALDDQLRVKYPDLKAYLPSLPPKEIFASMSPDVVERRQQGLEAYIGHIVTSLPTILRGRTIDRFLGIAERVQAIQNELAVSPRAGSVSAAQPTRLSTDREEVKSNADVADLSKILTSDDAQRLSEEHRDTPLNESGLSALEQAVASLDRKVRSVSPRTVMKDAELLSLVQYTQAQWPSLKASCAFGGDVDLTLIPRALQCDEDLQRVLADYKSILAVKQLQRGVV